MEKKFIIDIDHAELSIKSDMIALAKEQNPTYPLISAHGGHGGISVQQAHDILALGGLIYPFKPNGKGHMDFINKIKPIWEAERPGAPLPEIGRAAWRGRRWRDEENWGVAGD